MILLSTDFTGTNGDPWPSPWVTELVDGSSGGAIDIQADRGRMCPHDGGYTVARADAQVEVADFRWSGTVRFESGDECYCYLWFRSSAEWVSDIQEKVNGYYLYFGPNYAEFTFGKAVDGSTTNLHMTTDTTYTGNTDFHVVLEAEGDQLRAKLWEDGDPEPGAWTLEATDTTFASGDVAVSILSGAADEGREWALDELLIEALEDESEPPELSLNTVKLWQAGAWTDQVVNVRQSEAWA